MKNVAIIGAGLSGLTLGYRLGQKGHRVTIYEKSDETGGLLGEFKIDDTNLEKTYHHIFKTDKYIIDLIDELGLGNKLKWYPEKTALYYEGQIFPFMGAMDLLKFKPLDIVSKIRLGLVKIWLQFDNDWKKYENELAYLWMEKWCGQKAYQAIWEPLLKGKFHNFYDQVSMAWLWARIHTRGNSSELGYMDGGFGQITEKLEEEIEKSGGEIILNSKVEEKDLEKKFDVVISTTPAKKIDYLGAINLVFGSDQNISEYYWHNINDLKSPFLAFIQHTNLVSRNNYGEEIYYLGTYVPQSHRLMKMNDEKIRDEFFDYFKKIFPKFDLKKVKWSRVFKFSQAQQVVTTNYQNKIEPYKISDKIYHLNFSQIYPEDRGINYAVKEAEKLVKVIQPK